MQTQIDLTLPQDWGELSDKQLRYVYQLIAEEYSADFIKTLFLLHWSRTKVIGRQADGSYLLKKDKILFSVTPTQIAELLPHLAWLDAIPNYPVRLSKVRRYAALPADFSEVPLQTFIIADNLYQGFLQTQDDALLDQLGATLYGMDKVEVLAPYERVSVFYWFASLKGYLAQLYSDFFQPIPETNLLGTPQLSVIDAMNAQIRALTKGDITKEAQVLALDTHRALTELNAQAREYKELNAKLK